MVTPVKVSGILESLQKMATLKHDGVVKSLLLRHFRVGGNDGKLAKYSFYEASKRTIDLDQDQTI
jgi:hypothetical protein